MMTRITRIIVPAATLLAALAACSAPPGVDAAQAEKNANTPGWTGRTFVVGSTSTVAGDAQATYEQQKWQLGKGR
jgi:hypothetical protein